MPTRKRYRCRYCGVVLRAWLPMAQRAEGSMLLYHLSQHRPDQGTSYLARMETDDIGTVAAEAYEVVGEPET
jgi:hypothetical protein